MTTTTITTLPTLATAANTFDERARKALGQGLNFARSAGNALLEAKGLLPHGQFEKWVADNCKFSAATSQRYMRIAKRWPEIEAMQKRHPQPTMIECLELMAEPKSKASPMMLLDQRPLQPSETPVGDATENDERELQEEGESTWDSFLETPEDRAGYRAMIEKSMTPEEFGRKRAIFENATRQLFEGLKEEFRSTKAIRAALREMRDTKAWAAGGHRNFEEYVATLNPDFVAEHKEALERLEHAEMHYSPEQRKKFGL